MERWWQAAKECEHLHLYKVDGSESLQARPFCLWELGVQHDEGRGNGVTAPDLLHKADKALHGATDDDVVTEVRALQPNTGTVGGNMLYYMFHELLLPK